MSTIYFSKEHEWIRVEDGIGTVGISDYAQESLGDVVFVELPDKDAEFKAGDEAAVVESVKAASEVYAPVSGRIADVNEAIVDDPALVNSAPLDEGWFYKIELANEDELSGLMDEDAYRKYLDDLD